jgi:catechol 2,3-dioxygenase-like lactoylglutathione lyase family enzyme
MPLRYFGIRVRNLDRSLRFYGRALGLKEVSRGDLSEYGAGRWVLLEDPRSHQRLELNWYPRSSRFATRYVPGEGLDHIGFLLGKVPRSRLEAEYRRLLAAGARPTPITPKLSDGWVANVKDPDGNWIEIFRWPTPAEIGAQARADKKKKPRDPQGP